MRSYTVEVKVSFRAGHRLLPPYSGKCNNPHGEGYTAIIFLSGDQLDERGMILDFGEIKRQIKHWIDEHWDHAYIHNKNDKVGLWLKDNGFRTYSLSQNPTAEYMAEILFDIIKLNISKKVVKVGIVESFSDSVAWYEEKK